MAEQTKNKTTGKSNVEVKKVITIEPSISDGTWKNQDSWVKYFNAKQGVMISSSDVYQIGKAGYQNQIAYLRGEFNFHEDTWLETSTRVNFLKETDYRGARITQHYKSEVTESKEVNLCSVDSYWEIPIQRVLRSKRGLGLLQALFDTKDEGKTIVKTLERLSGINAPHIKLWVAGDHEEGREEYPKRAVIFHIGEDEFFIRVGSHYENTAGLSLAVMVKNVEELEQENKRGIYIPSIGLYLRRKSVYPLKSWEAQCKSVLKRGLKIPTIPEFLETLKFLRDSPSKLHKSLYLGMISGETDIVLDARFEKQRKRMYMHYNHLLDSQNNLKPQNSEEIETESMRNHQSFNMDLDMFVDYHTRQGFPLKNYSGFSRKSKEVLIDPDTRRKCGYVPPKGGGFAVFSSWWGDCFDQQSYRCLNCEKEGFEEPEKTFLFYKKPSG